MKAHAEQALLEHGHKRGDGAMGCEDEVSPWVREPHPGLVMASAPPPLGV